MYVFLYLLQWHVTVTGHRPPAIWTVSYSSRRRRRQRAERTVRRRHARVFYSIRHIEYSIHMSRLPGNHHRIPIPRGHVM